MGNGGSFVYNEIIEVLEQIFFLDKKSKGFELNCFVVVFQKKSSGGKSLWRKLLGRKKKSKIIKFFNLFVI